MHNSNQLKVLSLGLALGLTWGLGMFLLGIISWYCGWGVEMVNVMASLYIGFDPSLKGSVIGGIWGFFDCFIAGVLIAWIYNFFAARL